MFRVRALLSIAIALSAMAGDVTVLSNSSRRLVIGIDASDLKSTKHQRDGIHFIQFQQEGYLTESEPGGPILPVKRFQIVVPSGKAVTAKVSSRRVKTWKSDHLVRYQDVEPIHSSLRRSYSFSEEKYKQLYGAKTVEIVEEGYAGPDRIATILFRPVYYEPAINRITITQRLRVELDFVEEKTHSEPPLNSHSASLSRYLAINAPDAPPRDSNSKIDLIIAYEDHKASLARYLSFKRMLGRQLHEYYVRGKSADEIRAIIKQEFKSNPVPNSVWLVGNIDQIPSFRGSGDNTWSDFKYQDLSDDGIPDIAVGRVPAMNSTELGNFIEKAIQRELDQPKVGEILLTAGSDTSLGCPDNVSEVGEKFKPAGNDIELIKKYKTQVSTQDVVDGYNSDPNIIVYDGHGNRTSMAEIPLYISSLNQISNHVYPILLDIACLNANWTSSGASSRNFAESFLLQGKSGLAGIMASGGSGYGHDFFQTIAATMATGRKALSTDSKLNEIGTVILLAKIKHGTQDRTYWNYYGDPASSVWESTQ